MEALTPKSLLSMLALRTNSARQRKFNYRIVFRK